MKKIVVITIIVVSVTLAIYLPFSESSNIQHNKEMWIVEIAVEMPSSLRLLKVIN